MHVAYSLCVFISVLFRILLQGILTMVLILNRILVRMICVMFIVIDARGPSLLIAAGVRLIIGNNNNTIGGRVEVNFGGEKHRHDVTFTGSPTTHIVMCRWLWYCMRRWLGLKRRDSRLQTTRISRSNCCR